MQIVIDINELDFEVIKEVNELGGEWKTDIAGKCMKAIANGTPLPKCHGRLIDADVAYDKIAEQEGGNYVDMDLVGFGLEETPTIIEADTESEGEE